MHWVQHRHAPWYLGLLSFAEASFFPVPPDVMLAPMSLTQPARAWRFALISTIASVAGGLCGYLIGVWLFHLIEPWVHALGYWPAYLQVMRWFESWGFWAVFLAGISPIPYKVFTIAAGSVTMAVPAFVLASLIGRGMRFFLVAGLMYWGGARLEGALRRYIEWIGWILVSLVVMTYLWMRWR